MAGPDERRDAEGYRSAARIGGSRAPVWRIAAVVALAVGLVTLGVAGRGNPSPSAPGTATRTAPAGTATAAPTPLAAIYRETSATLPGPIPIFSNGLRWLDPASGTILGDAYAAPRGSLFRFGDDVLCVCADAPWSASGSVERFTLARATGGSETARVTIDDLELRSPYASPGAIQRGVDAGAGVVFVGYLLADGTAWQIGVEAVGYAFRADGGISILSHARRVLGAIPPIDQGFVYPPVVRVSPAGVARVSFRWRPSPEGALSEQAWTLVASGSGIDAVALPAVGPDVLDRCDQEGWAAADTYVRLCRTATGPERATIALERLGGVREVPLAGPVAYDTDVLADATHGVVWRWAPSAHLVSRIDVATGTVQERVLPWELPAGVPVAPEEPPPDPGGRRIRSPSLIATDFLQPRRMALSPDGTRLYLLGVRQDPSSPLPTLVTGVWELRADDLALLGRLGPLAADDQVGLTSDGAWVVTIARPGIDASGAPAPWGTSVVLWDAATRQAGERIGDVLGPDGYTPILLPTNG